MPYRCVVVGAGAMGRAWTGLLAGHPLVELQGWVDIDADQLARSLSDSGLAYVYADTDLRKSLKELQPDFIVDATVPEAHHEVTIAALELGTHVLGEKPMATSMNHAREMVAAAERASRVYMVSQNRRFNNQLRELKDLVSQLGHLGILNTDFFIGPHFGGFRESMPSPLILDMAIHTFDAARYLSGRDAASVYCEEFNPQWSWFSGSASATCLFEMTGDLKYIYRGSWCSEGCPTSWEGQWRAVGSHGSAIWDGSERPYAERVTGSEGFLREAKRFEAEPGAGAEGLSGSLEEFLSALDTGSTPMCDCRDNIKSLAMVHAAIESARLGRKVRVEA